MISHKDSSPQGRPEWKPVVSAMDGNIDASERGLDYLLQCGEHVIRVHLEGERVSAFFNGKPMGEASGTLIRLDYRIPGRKTGSDFYELTVLTSPTVRIFLDRNGMLYAHK